MSVQNARCGGITAVGKLHSASAFGKSRLFDDQNTIGDLHADGLIVEQIALEKALTCQRGFEGICSEGRQYNSQHQRQM